MSGRSLKSFLEENWAMMVHYKVSVEEAERMTPWEWEMYVALTQDYVKKKNEAR